MRDYYSFYDAAYNNDKFSTVIVSSVDRIMTEHNDYVLSRLLHEDDGFSIFSTFTDSEEMPIDIIEEHIKNQIPHWVDKVENDILFLIDIKNNIICCRENKNIKTTFNLNNIMTGFETEQMYYTFEDNFIFWLQNNNINNKFFFNEATTNKFILFLDAAKTITDAKKIEEILNSNMSHADRQLEIGKIFDYFDGRGNISLKWHQLPDRPSILV